ncbi:GNAT family N-acetyltransferase [Rarobacter faecitabidus]|uniref:Ribosomal protein S18 acetylase RimI-like enzyme n=1 Tax=Rarobacter faecitabidus TaxID=13243 RepID=A0A542ZVL1_RARFA|nr:GNAT family N-acetyltransferase [Rarobacter faecitabidus]TQL64361.1 ribosomal protein S18 acetylase RimI-like enzyme [Rarobacter faecitabidus]
MTADRPSVVRVAREHDAAAIAGLAARTFVLACPPGTGEADVDEFVAANLTESHFAAHVRDPAATVLIAESARDGGDPVGYALLQRSSLTPDVKLANAGRDSSSFATAALLSKFYVDPAFHGGGVAVELMASVLKSAASMSSRTIWLGVNDRNQRAIRFYSKHGFDVVGTRVFAVGAKLHGDLVMARPLRA